MYHPGWLSLVPAGRVGAAQGRTAVFMSVYRPGRADLQVNAVILLALGHFTVDFYAGFVAPLVPILRQSIGFSLTEAAFLISVFSLSSSFVQMGFGFLYDRLRSLHALALGPLLAGVTISCIGLASSFFTLVLVAIAGGVSVAAFHPQGAALAGIKSGQRLSVGMSIFVTGGAAGVAVGSLAASLIVEMGGLSMITYAMFPAIGVAFVIWRCLDDESPDIGPVPSLNDGAGLRFGLLLGLGGLAMLRASVILSYYAFLPLYLTAQGTPISTVGWTLFVFGLANGLGGLTSGFWAERVCDKNLLYVSYLLPLPLLWGYLLTGTSLEGLVCLALAGYVISLGIPVVISIGQRSFPKRMGTISSVLMGLSWGTAALLITPAGLIAERVGIYAVLWGFTFMSILGFVLTAMLFQRRLVPLVESSSLEPLVAD